MQMQTDRPDSSNELWERMLLHWRLRCVLRGAPIDATSGPAATDMCAAVVRTLESGSLHPALPRATRLWAATVSSGAQARDALQCLAEVTSEMAAGAFDRFPTAGLDSVVELLAAAARAAVERQDNASGEATARQFPNRKALVRDLEAAGARVESGALAVAVVEVATARQGAKLVHRHLQWELEEQVQAVAATMQLGVGKDSVYRLGRDKLALLAPGATATAIGPLMLRATCRAPRARLSWGVAGGRATVGERSDPEVLLILAEADLLLRRRDMAHARRALTQHRRRTALAAPAAALVLLVALVAGQGGTTLTPTPAAHMALTPIRAVPHLSDRGPSSPSQPQRPAPKVEPSPVQSQVPPPPIQPPGTPAVQTVGAIISSSPPPTTLVPGAGSPPAPPPGPTSQVSPPPAPPPPPPPQPATRSHGKPSVPPGNPAAPGKGHSNSGTPV